MAPNITIGCVDSEETGLCTNFGFRASRTREKARNSVPNLPPKGRAQAP
jgi:hypothetical protein